MNFEEMDALMDPSPPAPATPVSRVLDVAVGVLKVLVVYPVALAAMVVACWAFPILIPFLGIGVGLAWHKKRQASRSLQIETAVRDGVAQALAAHRESGTNIVP